MQQGGGVFPVQASPFDVGTAAPMIFQAASQPIDSGVTAAINFSQQESQRVQLRFRRHIMEAQRQMQEEGLDLQREQFEFMKKKFGMEYSLKERQIENQEALMGISLMQQMDTGVTNLLGDQGWTGMMSMAITPAQIEAVRTAKAAFEEARVKAGQAVVEDRDLKGAMQAEFEGRQALSGMIPATIQAVQLSKAAEAFKEGNGNAGPNDWMAYNPYIFNMGKAELMEQGVDAPVDLLYQSIDSLILSAVEANKDKWGFPQAISTYPGMIAHVQQSADIGFALKNWIKDNDPTGSLRKEYELRSRLDPSVRDTGVTYEEWVNIAVDERVDAIVGNPNYKVNNVDNTGLEAQYDSTTASVPVGRNVFGVEGVGQGGFGLGGSIVAIPGEDLKLDYDLKSLGQSSNLLDRIYYSFLTDPDFGTWENMKGDIERSGQDGLPPNKTVADTPMNNHKLMIGASLFDGVAFTDYDQSLYLNEDRTLTERGREIAKQMKKFKKEAINVPTVTHGLTVDEIEEIQNRLNLSDASGVNDLARSLAGGDGNVLMEVTPKMGGKGSKMYNRQDFVDEFDGKTTKITINEYVSPENPFAFHAMLDGGDMDPWAWGAAPLIVTVSSTGSGNAEPEIRDFLMPRDRVWQDNYPQIRAMNQLYMRGIMGGGEQMTPGQTPGDVQGMMNLLMDEYRSHYTPEQYAENVEKWASGLKAVQVQGESMIGEGPHKIAEQGDLMMVFEWEDGAEGSMSVSDLAAAPEAIRIAETLANNLSEKDTFAAHGYYDPGMRAPVYAISINGGEQQLVYDHETIFNLLLDHNAPAQRIAPDNVNDPMGSYGGLMGMSGIQNKTVNMTLSDVFMDDEFGLRKLDKMLVAWNQQNGTDTQYLVTSAYRPDDVNSPHSKGMAIDWKFSRELYNFFDSVTEDFAPSPTGRAVWYNISGTNLMVALHDNRGTEGGYGNQHFDIRFRKGVVQE